MKTKKNEWTFKGMYKSPKDPQTPSLLIAVYRSLGRKEDLEYAAREAVEIGVRKLEIEPDNWRSCFSVAFGFLNLGQYSNAQEYLTRVLENNPEDAIVNYNAACLYSGMGELGKALKHLEISLKQGKGIQFMDWIKNDSDLDMLRDHPQFRELLENYL